MSKDKLEQALRGFEHKFGQVNNSGLSKGSTPTSEAKKSIKSKGNSVVIVTGDVHAPINVGTELPSDKVRASESLPQISKHSAQQDSRYEQLKYQQLESHAESKRILMIYIARHMKIRQFCVVAVVLSIAAFVIGSFVDSNTISMYAMGAFVVSTLKMTANELGLSSCQKKIKDNCFFRPGDEFNESLSPDENDQGFGPIDRFKKS